MDEKEVPIMAIDLTTPTSWIQKTPGVCGGDACVRNTRITVYGLVNYKKLGFNDSAILHAIQGLTHDDLLAAWDYDAHNPSEIAEAIRLNEEV
jgi:uncharacterized protein (DUF433 family)